MERLDEFKTTPTVTLINMLCESEKNGEQKLVNICAYELACRIWVPNKEKDFKTMLYDKLDIQCGIIAPYNEFVFKSR